MDNLARSLPFSFPGVPGVRCLFSTRHAGTMSRMGDGARATALRHRAAFKRDAGFRLWSEVHQIHGDVIVRANGDESVDPDNHPQADGLYTFRPDDGLIIKSADCQPLLLAREDGRAVAALHVGWRGNAMNFPGTAVARLARLFDCGPASLLAVRGPSLGPAAAEFVNFADEWPAEFEPWFDPDSRTVNLWGLTRHQLREAGVRAERIFSLDMCTRDMREHFFSHRRGDAGRQIAAVWMEG